ncbi:MAG: hypothetical protein HC862_00080 [Scytonema sp. RU_4_4]|nr:hypothetical protein [Scytonema sp. RU_4_4]NJR73292.1 hypothetical protein [Scytonema sp. CRU_2_7]
MKRQIDALLAKDEKLLQFLIWLEQKSKSVEARYKPAAIRAFYQNLDLALALALARDLALDLALDRARALDQNPELRRSLQRLKDQLPNPEDKEVYKQWWQENGSTWTEQLRAVMIEHRNIGHDWQFTDAQEELLKQYYDANKLLVDCLNSDCYVSREARQEIEDTLLLPNAT